MKKMVILSVALVALLASSAPAQLEQVQSSAAQLANAIALMNGDQAADSIQNLALSNDQVADNVAYQGFVGNFAQIGHAWGACGLIGVDQTLDSTGLQSQLVGGCCDPKMNLQTLGLTAGQAVSKDDGAGGANALHQIVLKEDQDATNAAGSMNESAAVLGLQSSDLTGEACALGVSESVMAISTSQSQSTLAPVPPAP